MKLKTGFLGFLLPVWKQINLKIRSVNWASNGRQVLFAWALLILWLLIFILIQSK